MSGTGPRKLAEIVVSALDVVVGQLSGKLRAGTDGLPPVDMDSQQIRAFVLNDPEIRKICLEGWFELEKTYFEEKNVVRSRTYIMERLLISRFEKLLVPAHAVSAQGLVLSRQAIPAILAVFRQLAGPQIYDQYSGRADQLLQRVQAQEGDSFAWDTLYRHPEAIDLANGFLMVTVHHLRDVAKRRKWMVEFCSRIMAATAGTADLEWHFGDAEFHLLIGALFLPIMKTLENAGAKEAFTERYGETATAAVMDMLVAMKQDRDSVLSAQQDKVIDSLAG